MRIALIDNYDSFTYNLKQYLDELADVEIDVVRNDEKRIEEFDDYDAILISPGPGIPSEAGICEGVIKHYSGQKPILGVCLGLQSIVTANGGSLLNLNRVFHGVSSQVTVIDQKDPMLTGLPETFEAGRYHSWVAQRDNFPKTLLISAIDEENMIMAIRHVEHQTYGVQFHPESILTPRGKDLLKNFLNMIKPKA